MVDKEEYMTVQEVAILLKVNPLTVRRWLSRGRLQKHLYRGHFVRIRKREVEEFGNKIISVNKS